ncbi:hypothetical protein ACLQ22_10105 [Micromonospora sp. DT178]
MPEEVLQGLQVGAGLVGKGRGAVAQVVQPHRGSLARRTRIRKRVVA